MKSLIPSLALWCAFLNLDAAQFSPAVSPDKATRGDALLTEYLQSETALLTEHCLSNLTAKEGWPEGRPKLIRQYREMLGLSPMPERTDLKPVVTGRLESDEFTVEKLCFQASPGLYCTANLYIPKGLKEPAPAVLYECGHWKYITNGISYGNKAVYQIDGAWYARNGYVCLVLDTLLAGEIQGIHTGTRDHGLWWWNSRGYTPAGVEAWFGMRALDYLCTRPEVDTNRFGITGHSGGGAYSWAITALDDRIKVAAPLAGMTDLKHHILDNLMDSHCDCNFPINIYRWDFPQLAALAAPRPLLIGGTDNDGLFPLEGTRSIYEKVRQVYETCNAKDNLGLIIAPGIHDEVPELRLAVMRWFNRYLKGVDRKSEPPIVVEAKRFFKPEQLRVFETVPADAINTNIAATFVAEAPPQHRSAEELRRLLRAKVFAGWPNEKMPLKLEPRISAESTGLQLKAWDFVSQHDVPLRLYLLEPAGQQTGGTIRLQVLDREAWTNWLAGARVLFEDELDQELVLSGGVEGDKTQLNEWKNELAKKSLTLAFVAPRGVGLTAWSGDTKRITRVRRRFMLLGQTVDSMRVWDIRRAIESVYAIRKSDPERFELKAAGEMAVNALYAALFEPRVNSLRLSNLPESQIEGPDYLDVLKVTDIREVKAAVDGS